MDKEDIKARIRELRADYCLLAAGDACYSGEVYRKMHRIAQELMRLQLLLVEESEKNEHIRENTRS